MIGYGIAMKSETDGLERLALLEYKAICSHIVA